MGDGGSDTGEDPMLDSLICVAGSSIKKSGFIASHSTDERERRVIFVNAGGEELRRQGHSEIEVEADRFFQGGDVLRTDEEVADGGDLPSIYQSARYGNFCYEFRDLPPGDYSVDLHFAEIVYTNGPRGMRVFNVFIQDEKAVSELDVYSIVGANRALQVMNIPVSAGKDGVVSVNFQGVVGSPTVSGICIKQGAPELQLVSSGRDGKSLLCDNCFAPVKLTAAENKAARMSFTAKYEREIRELKAQCQMKQDECYEAWMSLTAANQELEKVRAELDVKFFQNFTLGQAMEKETEKMAKISSKYEHDRRLWVAAIDELERKMKAIKSEHSQLSFEAHQCANSIPGLNQMVTAVQSLGNIRVFCRCRPLNMEEASSRPQTVVEFTDAKDGDLGVLMNGSNKKIYKFDRVYTPKDDQCDVFEDASPVATSVLDGYNVCIFAYGQTGTGKTFTMEGTEQNRGVNYRTLELLFKIAEDRKKTISYDISVSVLEVYNEQVRDLLASSPPAKRLEIKQVSEGVNHVPGVVDMKVENVDEVWNILQTGSNARAVGSNNVNGHSSRSHCMICTVVRAKNLVTGECTRSKLWLVDLAGSERLAKTDVQGERLKEAQSINKSLSALGDVISALATKSSHIPYRNSKLTHLLQDSLGGDSKTLMFVQISPSEHDLGETVSSLNFATRVRGVELGPAKKQSDTTEIQKLKLMLPFCLCQLKCKDDTIRKLEENVQALEGKTKSKEQFSKSQQDKIIDLENQVELKAELCGHLEKRLSQVYEKMQRKEEACYSFQQKVKELEDRLQEQEQASSINSKAKTRELEDAVKEKSQQFQRHTEMLQKQIKMLEEELEAKQGREYMYISEPTDTFQARKVEAKPLKIEADPFSLRSLNSTSSGTLLNRGEQSILLKGTDSLRALRHKRDLQSKGPENNLFLVTPTAHKKPISAESEPSKARHLDPSRAFARISRGGKPVGSGSSAFPNRVKESDSSRVKIWLR
ncbi:unnamed protein product [Linum tenue]|uniref:Kinesin-like protein n=1 Tax=Linum tenue TaxID=586396 RepID=A0AAV0JB52_9ROSI|nr:unnamed protein product [Linum tenue]